MKMGKGGKCRDSATKIKHASSYSCLGSAASRCLVGWWRRIPPANSDMLPGELSGGEVFRRQMKPSRVSSAHYLVFVSYQYLAYKISARKNCLLRNILILYSWSSGVFSSIQFGAFTDQMDECFKFLKWSD